jgi:hypothetical protein
MKIQDPTVSEAQLLLAGYKAGLHHAEQLILQAWHDTELLSDGRDRLKKLLAEIKEMRACSHVTEALKHTSGLF